MAPPGDTKTKLNAPAQLQIYPTMSTTVSKFKRIKVDTSLAQTLPFKNVTNEQKIIELFLPSLSDKVPARHVNRYNLDHFYASPSFSDSVYSFAAMLGAPNFWERHPRQNPVDSSMPNLPTKIDLGVI